jgi:sugar lactone lactonase YvrE
MLAAFPYQFPLFQIEPQYAETRIKSKEKQTMKLNILLATLALCLSLTANAQPANSLSGVNGIAFDTQGHLWAANPTSNTVVELNPANGALLHTISRGLDGPTRLFFASPEILYVANTNGNNITVYNIKTLKLVRTISNSHIDKPLGVVADAYGDVYIANNAPSANNVIALNIDGDLIETLTQDKSGFPFTAPGVLVIHGQDIYVGLGPNQGTNAVISYNVGEFLTGDPKEINVYNDNVNTGPTAITFDSKGDVYIAEYTSNTAIEYTPDGKHILLVIGQEHLNGPEGIALDGSGNIYISNSNLSNIAVFDSKGNWLRNLD